MSHFSRRHWLMQNAFSLSSVAALWAASRQSVQAVPPKPSLEPKTYDLTQKTTASAPQATAMISMFMQGGPSHIDMFDPKPSSTNAISRLTPVTSSMTTPVKPAANCLAAHGGFDIMANAGWN